MITFWGFALGLPLLAVGGVMVCSRTLSERLLERFEASRLAAGLLTAFGWVWTAYECDTIGIDVFDMVLLKHQTGGLFVWALAALLTYLVIIWMPKNLSVRALSGVLMLIPAELFQTTRLLLPESGFAPVDVFVVTGYLGAVLGMFGMFYPWHVETALKAIVSRRSATAALGAAFAADALAMIVIGCIL